MKRINTFYWIFTALLSLGMIFSALPNIMVNAQSVEIFKHLQYPEYLIRFVGLAKLFAVIAILIPGFNRLKEWAYAGLVFDLTGAFYGGLSVGDAFMMWLPSMIIGYGLIAGSYIFHHKRLKAKALYSEPAV